jgi:sarcosine oxidase subunit beta
MDIEGAALLPGVAHVSPMKVVRELVVRSVAMGAEVWPATEVTGIDVEGERIRGVTTNRGFLAAAWVVVAAGVWSTKVCAGLGLNLPIRPLKGNVLVTEPVGAFVQHYVAESRLEPIGGQPESGLDVEREGESAAELVMQNLPSGSILIGSTKQHHAADLDVDRVSVAAIAERALRFFPSLRQVRILRTYCGWRPWVPDGHPIIGPVAGVGGLIVAAGHAGNGNTWALLTGALVADMISGRPSAVAVSALSPNRFASTGQ